MKYTISREDSKYNKYMKWHLVGLSELGRMSMWYKTRKEAEYDIIKFDNQERTQKWAQMAR